MLNIIAADYYVPNHFIDLKNSEEFYGLSKYELNVFTRLYGLEKIPSAKNMALTELLSIPIKKIFQDNSVNNQSIKYLIYAHTSKVVNSFSQSAIKFLKQSFNFNNAIMLETTINNCASTISAIEIAGNLLKSDSSDAKALIVTGELTFTEIQKVIPKISILGDASAALLLGNNGVHHKLLSIEMKVDGKSSEGVWMNQEKSKEYERDYAPTLSQVIRMALKKANINLSDLSFIFPHNVNLPSWKKVISELNIPINKIYLSNVRKYSHCFGADIVINFVDAERERLIEPGDFYVMATVGLGSIYAAAVFQY